MIALFLVTVFALTIYSYSQIDLNLTLIRNLWFLDFQKALIALGYFHRMASTGIFLAITALLFLVYGWLLRRSAIPLTRRKLIVLFGGIILVGIFSYPAFSHDIFNAMFYPRLIVFHRVNPYQFTALDFPADTWTRFMQWTHVPYQWGPLYLVLSVPVYLLGFGKFVLTLFWFKIFNLLAYFLAVGLIGRLSGQRGVLVFAFNPLIIYEVVVAGHLDIVMLVAILAAIYFLEASKVVASWVFWLASVAIKFVTGLFLPLIIFWPKLKNDQKKWGVISVGLAGFLVQLWFRGLLPHYLIVPIGTAAVYSQDRRVSGAIFAVSLVILLARYWPFIETGQWWTWGL